MELIAPVRVVVVDDRQEHLFAIANALSVLGIPCISHLYDKETNQLVPKPPEIGYADIRLVITDLNIRNFTGGNVDAKALGAILLSDVLIPILPAGPAPYGLVLWSSVSGVTDDVRSFINERIDHHSLAPNERRTRPLSIELMNKGEFVSNLAIDNIDLLQLMTEVSQAAPKIRAQLERALNDPQLRLVCAWEMRVSQSATATINSVYQAATLHATKTNAKTTDALNSVLVKLANEAAGFKSAAEDPVRALDDGLIDLFVDDLRSAVDDGAYSQLVNASLGDGLGKGIDVSSEVRHQLNTSLHVETNISGLGDRISRGVVLGSDDQVGIAKRLGYDEPKDVIWEEFLFPTWLFKKAATGARGSEREASLELRYTNAKALEDDVPNQCHLRLLEIGADCDHANKRKRTVRLLCALEVPERFADFIWSPCDGQGMKNDSLMKWGPWNIDGRDGVLLLVSVRRFTIQQQWPLPDELKPKYRLRRQLVDMVLREYANHSSRLGYVAIT